MEETSASSSKTDLPVESSEPPGTFSCARPFGARNPEDRIGGSAVRQDTPNNRTSAVPKSGKVVIHPARFVVSSESLRFRKRFFPEATAADWNNWKWHIRNRIRSHSLLSKILVFSPEEEQAVLGHGQAFPVSVTPYFAGLLHSENPLHPLRRTVVPVTAEMETAPGEAEDPLGEDAHSPVPGLVHRYPDRVLFLVTGFCSTFCRYCTRSRIVGRESERTLGRKHWERALGYIENTPSVRDVLLSGGDPLTLKDDVLEWLLGRVRRIPHVEVVRIGTKVPVVLPQRITPALVKVLRKYHPLWMSIHFTHPEEITPETALACNRLADAGIPLGSQTVLLKGINDSVETMKRLVHGLLRMRVRPYYLYQCDPIKGSSHFRTPVEKGIEIIQGLRGHTSGYAVPHYVIDAPGGGGKIPLLPEYWVGRDGDDLLLRNYQGNTYRYPDPVGDSNAAPAGVQP